jgi:hypothetical protein
LAAFCLSTWASPTKAFFEEFLRNEAMQGVITVDDVVRFFDEIPGAKCEGKLRELSVDGATMLLLSTDDMCSELGIESRIVAKKIEARVFSLREKGAQSVSRLISNAVHNLSNFHYAYLDYSFCTLRDSDHMMLMATSHVKQIAQDCASKSIFMQHLSHRDLDEAMFVDVLWPTIKELTPQGAMDMLETVADLNNPPKGSATRELNRWLPIIGCNGKSEANAFFDDIRATYMEVERPARESNMLSFYRSIYLNAACKSKLGFEMTNEMRRDFTSSTAQPDSAALVEKGVNMVKEKATDMLVSKGKSIFCTGLNMVLPGAGSILGAFW